MSFLPDGQKQAIRTIRRDRGVSAALRTANDLIGGYGVEYAAHRDDTAHRIYGLEYVNMGDAYAATVVYDHQTHRFLWGANWGSIVESREGQYA